MTDTPTPPTTPTPQTSRTPVKVAQSASTLLRAGTAIMLIAATVRADGSATTAVTIKDGAKPSQRGMSETHKNLDAAKAAIMALAAKAEKLGWVKGGGRGFSRPDAFTTLPAAPKAPAKK